MQEAQSGPSRQGLMPPTSSYDGLSADLTFRALGIIAAVASGIKAVTLGDSMLNSPPLRDHHRRLTALAQVCGGDDHQ